jgi:hypothetical protein
VLRTPAVTTRTTLLLVRHRYHLVLPGRGADRTQVAEEARLLAYTGDPAAPVWLSDTEVELLAEARAGSNVAGQARAFAEHALATLDTLAPTLDEHATGRARALLEAHRRVRAAAGEMRRGLTITPQLPVDVLGVYVYLPVPATRAVR